MTSIINFFLIFCCFTAYATPFSFQTEYENALSNPVKEEKRTLLKKLKNEIDDGLKQNPNSAELIYWWVACEGELIKTGDLISAAIKTYEIEKKLLLLKKVNPQYLSGAADRILAAIYRIAPSVVSIGSKTKWFSHAEQAYQIDPNYPPNVLEFSRVLLKQDKTTEARKILEHSIQILNSKASTFKATDLEIKNWKKDSLELLNETL
jgi:hypothetical protein